MRVFYLAPPKIRKNKLGRDYFHLTCVYFLASLVYIVRRDRHSDFKKIPYSGDLVLSNALQRYLKFRGITSRAISDGTGHGYHAIQKTVTGERSGRVIRQVIADYLELPYAHVWGKKSEHYLNNYIEKEIDRRLTVQRKSLRKRYLSNYTHCASSTTKVCDEKTIAEAGAVSNG